VYVVHEGLEQPLGWLADSERVTVTVRSKDKGGRLVSWVAQVTSLDPVRRSGRRSCRSCTPRG
jgi:hypothetical protein